MLNFNFFFFNIDSVPGWENSVFENNLSLVLVKEIPHFVIITYL